MKTISKPDKKLKFLFLTADKYPPFRSDVKILFGRELAGRGHLIDWILQSENPCRKAYHAIWEGGRVWVGPADKGAGPLSRLKKRICDILGDLKLFQLMAAEKYDFIQVKDKFISALFGLWGAEIYKSKFIFWLSYPFPEANIYKAVSGAARYPLLYFIRGHFIKYLLYNIILPKSDHIFVQSVQMQKDLAAQGIPNDKMTAVPMGISLEKTVRQNPASASSCHLQLKAGEKMILYVGTLTRVRKLDFLIRVLAEIVPRYGNLKLCFAGCGEDPADERMLRDEALRIGVKEYVIFSGFLSSLEVQRYILRADICVSPFYPTFVLNSTSPTKIIEYMALGRAVVANDHPEQRIILSESGGGICVPYDEKAFAGAILELLHEPDKAAKMGAMGREYVLKNRNYRIIADMLEKEYYSIMGRRSYSRSF